ncbi:MBG domain-containing protein [Ruminococcaceae bacterium OttesenSCG-928-L11]|nr:MBG domain-containing protein [Ruminococcaceae bacterium OttesenSCG-928-L11]
MKSTISSKILAMALAVCLLLSGMPIGVLAAQEAKLVLGFSDFEGTATVSMGTATDQLPLPDTLRATVDGEDDPADIPVDWAGDDGYNSEVSGDYGFTAVLGEGYALADDVDAPVFTVTVAMGIQLYAANNTVDITGMAVADMTTAIEAALADNSTVTVIGGTADAPVDFGNEYINFSIPAGATVLWQAHAVGSSYLIIIMSSDINSEFKVDGGTLTGTGEMPTIELWSGAAGTLSVSSGKVENTGTFCAIQNSRSTGTVAISGGTVRASSTGNTIRNEYAGTVVVSGGIVENTGAGHAIQNSSAGTVVVSGGTVQNSGTGYAIENVSDGAVTISQADESTPTLVTSRSAKATIYQAAAELSGVTTISVTGGAVTNTGAGWGIYNNSDGTVSTTGGIITGGLGSVYNPNGTGHIPSDLTVDITGYNADSMEGLLQFAIDCVASGNTVTVVGGTENALVDFEGTNTKILIPAGVTVQWQAYGTGHIYITDSSSGSFEVASGALLSSANYYSILNFGTGSVTISGGTTSGIYNTEGSVIVAGGTVSVPNNKDGIVNAGEENTGTVTVTSGVVRSDGGRAIYAAGGTVVVSGGTIETSGGIYGHRTIEGLYADITISGGTVTSNSSSDLSATVSSVGSVTITGGIVTHTGNGSTIMGDTHLGRTCTTTISGGVVQHTGTGPVITNRGTLEIDGGLVANAGTGKAIYNDSAASETTVSGGTVFAIGSTLADIVEDESVVVNKFSGPSSTGVALAWDSSVSGPYAQGSTNGIFKLPAAATAAWGVQDNEGGIAYQNGTNAGFVSLPDASVTGVESKLTADNLSFTLPQSLVYNGSAQGIGAVTAKAGVTGIGTIKVYYEGISPTVYAKNTVAPTNAGSYAVTAEIGTGTVYSSTKIALGSYTISPKALTSGMLAITGTYTYDGTAKSPTYTVTDGNTTLIKDTDYTETALPSETNVGSYTLTVTGKGNYSGTASQTFTIAGKALTDSMLAITGTYIYDGTAKSPVYTVTDGTALTPGVHYTAPSLSKTDAGSYAFTVTGKGNYSGTATQTFTIAKADLMASDLSYSLAAVTYDGAAKPVNVTVSDKTGYGILTVYYTGTNGTVYARSSSAPTNAGDYSVAVRASGGDNINASGSDIALSGIYIINKASLSSTNQSLKVKSGLAHTYNFALSDMLPTGIDPSQISAYSAVETVDSANILTVGTVSGTTLPLTIANTAVGANTATVKVSFASDNYAIADATLTISVTDKYPVSISGVTVTSRTYNGEAVAYSGTPVFTSTVQGTTVSTLTPIYTWSSGSAPINAGSYTLTISADGGTDYDVADLMIGFEITKAAQTISFPAPSINRVGKSEALTATASSGQTIAYASSDTAIATVTGGMLELLAEGVVTITASQPGDGNYYAAADVAHTITVTRENSSDNHEPINPPVGPINTQSNATVSFTGEFVQLEAIQFNGQTLTQTPNGTHIDLSGYGGYSGVVGKAESGSVKVTLYKEFLQTLPDGTYTLTVGFNDGGSGSLPIEIKNTLVDNNSDNSNNNNSNNNSSGNKSGGGGSGGSGGGGGAALTRPILTVNEAKAKAALTDMQKTGRKKARITGNGQIKMTPSAWQALGSTPVDFDTLAKGAVQLRITVKNPGKMTSEMHLSGELTGSAVNARKAFFEKWFKNKVQVIHLDQSGSFGQPVEIVAKVDLTGMNAKQLVLYVYDRATNTYKRIENSAYWIDQNGYLHFTTEVAGDIIISDGALTPKGQN